ncbi:MULTISPECIES: ferritin-like domain-containing protein [Saccharothrix]|uniref:ferritin-like domain-containing protein n=1 Tax=Saccharothrix TaxID=2071 RepID=UPI0027D2AC5A|nr:MULTISPECIES: ferritin-like domain-containing protein [Saccharothrix]MDU0293369.1 ferritin-like domain-containing protein [Saccharothrix longispora]
MSVDAVQDALAAEHAAVWTYGLVSAFIEQQAAAVADGANAHRARRDTTERWLRDQGATPRPPAAAYLPPQPVDSAASAIAALIAVEADACAAWRGVLERTDDGALRRSALDALTVSAVRGTRWRKVAGVAPLSITMPGAAVG